MTAADIAAVLFIVCLVGLVWTGLAVVIAVLRWADAEVARHVDAALTDPRIADMLAYHADYRAAVDEDAVNEAAWEEAVALGNSHALADSEPAQRIAALLAANEAARADWSELNRWADQ